MPGSFSKIWKTLSAGNLYPVGTSHLFGEENVYDLTKGPPRIVWVPPDEERWDSAAGYAGDTANNPRAIHYKQSMWEAHCWAFAPVGAITLDGDSTGTLLVTGKPIGDIPAIVIRIDGDGQAGVAAWSYSLDGGVTYTSVGAVVSAALGTTGLTVWLIDDFQAVTPSFFSGDTFSFKAPGDPWDHYDAVEALAHTVLQTLRTLMWADYFYRFDRIVYQKANGAVEKFGRAAVVFFEFQLPVTMPPEKEATFSATPVTGQIQNYLIDD